MLPLRTHQENVEILGEIVRHIGDRDCDLVEGRGDSRHRDDRRIRVPLARHSRRRIGHRNPRRIHKSPRRPDHDRVERVGVADGAGFTNANINALPGACIMYRIVATNEGVSPVTSVLINDTTPSFTTLFDKLVGGAVTTATTPVVTGGTVNTVPTKPADGAAGALQANVGTLNGTQSATFTFSVKIDQ